MFPPDVAARLNVSASQARRYARCYERVHGELPKDARGGRIYPLEAVEEIEAGLQAMTGGAFASLEAALVARRDGALPAAATPSRGDVLAVTLRDHGDRLARIEDRLLSERDELRAELADSQRRVSYLVGELQRRGETQQQRPRWWRRGAHA